MSLLIPDITEAVPSVLEIERDFCFKVVCGEDFYMAVESDKELCLWLNLINHIRLGRNISLFDAPHFSRESKALSDESLITSFSLIKTILIQREDEMIESLNAAYDDYKDKAEEEHKNLSESLTKEIENCKIVTESLSSENSVLAKIQQIQRLTKDRQTFKPFDSMNEGKLQISMDQEVVQKLTRPNIKISLRSHAEWHVRRTNITRALKWRYTGTRIDALTFMVSHDIILAGVGLCGPYKQGGAVTIKDFQVLKGPSSNSSVIYKHASIVIIKYNPDESVHKINIEKNLLIKSNCKYTVTFTIEGSHTYKCVDCVGQIEGDVTWNFFSTSFSQNQQTNRCDVTCGPIADFHYILN